MQGVTSATGLRCYDAQQALSAFAVRVREQLDLPSLNREVVATVGSTVQPTSILVWIIPSVRARR